MFNQESLAGQVVALVFCRLDEVSKKKGRLVCREWRRLMEKYFLRFVPVLNDTSYPFLQNMTNVHLDTLAVQDFTRDTEHDSLNLSCPTNLIFRRCNSSATRQSISKSNIEKILWLSRDMKTLVFDENSLRFIRHINIEGLQLRNLTHLMISLRNRKFDVNEENVLLQLSRVKMPVLTSLRLHSLLLSGDTENAILYSSLFEFIALHATTIKNLSIRHCFKPYSNLNQKMDCLNLPWSKTKFESIRQDMSNLALKNVSIFLDKYEGVGQFTLGTDLLASQYYLNKLEIQVCDDVDSERSHELYYHIKTSIERNLSSLRHLCVSRCNIETSIWDLEEILRATYHCSDLDSLKLFIFNIPTFPHPLPPTLKFLELMGTLYLTLLAEIRSTLPQLEYLQFANLTEDYLVNIEQHQYEEMRLNLRKLLTMPRLRLIKWHCPKFDLEFISDIRGVSVNNNYSSIITIQK